MSQPFCIQCLYILKTSSSYCDDSNTVMIQMPGLKVSPVPAASLSLGGLHLPQAFLQNIPIFYILLTPSKQFLIKSFKYSTYSNQTIQSGT